MSIVENTFENRNNSTVFLTDSFSKKNIEYKNYKILSDNKILIPRNYNYSSNLIWPGNDVLISKNLLPIFKEEQKKVIEKVISSYNENDFYDSVIVRPTGYGKTIIALGIFSQIKKKAIVIVNRINLLKQWENEIKKFFPEIKIGIINGKTFTDGDIIISTIQTIALKDSITSFKLKQLGIGLLILDEIHTIPGEKFINVLFKLNCKCKIGLTATFDRKDSKHKLVEQHFGNIDILTVQKTQKTIVEFIYTNYNMSVIYNRYSSMNYSEMLNEQTQNLDRNNLILDNIKRHLEDGDKHILVVSDRINQLKYFHEQLKQDSCLYIGKNKVEDISKYKVILGTSSIVSTGLNIVTLNCIVLASSKASIIQTIGRIFRQQHTVATIVDFVDEGTVATSQYRKRKKQYSSELENVNFDYNCKINFI